MEVGRALQPVIRLRGGEFFTGERTPHHRADTDAGGFAEAMSYGESPRKTRAFSSDAEFVERHQDRFGMRLRVHDIVRSDQDFEQTVVSAPLEPALEAPCILLVTTASR